MKMVEIIVNPPRDEYLDKYAYHFDQAKPVATIKGLTLKKATQAGEIHYGLFDDQNRFVGYLALELRGDRVWEAVLVQLAQAYKGLGYGTFLYDYAVMNDKLKVISDATHTSGPHGSINLWRRLKDNGRYPVVGYNINNNEILYDATAEDVYNNKTNMRWIALPSDKTINETIESIQSHMKKRTLVWYGPGTTTETYFNY